MQSSCSTRANPLVKETSERLYKSRNTTGDIKFRIDDVEIPAHKCVLAAFSPKYQRQFYGDFDDRKCDCIELKEPNVSAAAFNEYLQFFYLDQVCLTHENIADVLFLAKESLVEEFYNECSKFLSETLSIENVCQSYELAHLHDYGDLLLSCERLIKSKLVDVFGTNGFLSSSRTVLLEIVRLAGPKCRAKCVFDACISWAQNFCCDNDMDPNNEHLRVALGDVLYEIRFDTMAFEDFVKYYRPFKTLFTEDEREEILQLIGKIADFEPQWFKCTRTDQPASPRDNNAMECDKGKKTETENSIKCSRILVKGTSQTPYHGTFKTSFSTSCYIEMNSILCGTLYDENASGGVDSLFDASQNQYQTIRVKIIEKDALEEHSFGHMLLEEEKILEFYDDQEACITLSQPIDISPISIYEISIEFSDRLYLQTCAFRNDIDIGHGIVRFYGNAGPVTGLKFSLKESDSN